MSYVTMKNILYNGQYGFRKGHSTYMAVMEMCDKITEARDNNLFSIGVFFDLSKAFDTVNHDILFKKLEHYGVRGICLDWLRDYLNGRRQCVLYNGQVSHILDIKCGVPQGSILGPLLFLIYVNDISNTSPLLQFIMFADDTNVFMSNNSLTELVDKLNAELEKVDKWFKANKLSLNLEKTNYILFCSKHKKALNHDYKISVNIDKQGITRVSSAKFLGVHIDELLCWKEHITDISKKIAKNIGIISRIRHFLPRHILVNLYYSLIYPYLSYCNLTWASTYRSRLASLTTLQKRALRIICKAPFRAHTKNLFLNLDILPFECINKLQVGLFMYKCHMHLLPVGFGHWFRTNSEVHGYLTRSYKKFHQQSARTNIRQHSVRIYGPVLWNSLPIELTVLPTIHQFKNRLKVYFMSNWV